MPKKIKLNGEVISNDDSWIYDWLDMEYISPKLLETQLMEAAGEEVEVYINSPGGSVWAGSEMYTSLKEYDGKVTAKITGIAASAASFMAMGADEILMSPTAQLMIHNSSTTTWGDKNDHESGMSLLSSTDEAVINAYVLKTGKPRDELLALMNKTTWLNPQEAIKSGFADQIMFDEGKVLVTNSAAPSGLSPEVIQRLKNKLLNQRTSGVKPEDTSDQPIHVKPEGTTTIKNEEDDKPMDFKELQDKHPSLVNEIMTQAINAERGRITALNALSGVPGAAQFIQDAIANGETAGEVAMKIVQASAERVKTEGQNRLSDAKNSGALEVVAEQPADQEKNEAADEQAAVENMVKYAQDLIDKKGGRK